MSKSPSPYDDWRDIWSDPETVKVCNALDALHDEPEPDDYSAMLERAAASI